MRKLLLFTALLLLPSAVWAACITDDTGVEVCLDAPPARGVSLYGAFSELLWELDAGPTLVGRTKNDTTIPEMADLPVVGTGLRPDVEYLMALRPDLIVSRGSRSARQALEALRGRGLSVAAFDPRTVDDLISVIDRLGTLWGAADKADALATELRTGLDEVSARVTDAPTRPLVAYEVRADPLTLAGADGLVDELIRIAGGRNAVETQKKLVMFDVEALLARDPDVYIVQEGPMNRNPSDPGARPHHATLRAVRDGRVLEVDEKLMSRPGPRVVEAARTLSRFLHPALWE